MQCTRGDHVVEFRVAENLRHLHLFLHTIEVDQRSLHFPQLAHANKRNRSELARKLESHDIIEVRGAVPPSCTACWPTVAVVLVRGSIIIFVYYRCSACEFIRSPVVV